MAPRPIPRWDTRAVGFGTGFVTFGLLMALKRHSDLSTLAVLAITVVVIAVAVTASMLDRSKRPVETPRPLD